MTQSERIISYYKQHPDKYEAAKARVRAWYAAKRADPDWWEQRKAANRHKYHMRNNS